MNKDTGNAGCSQGVRGGGGGVGYLHYRVPGGGGNRWVPPLGRVGAGPHWSPKHN